MAIDIYLSTLLPIYIAIFILQKRLLIALSPIITSPCSSSTLASIFEVADAGSSLILPGLKLHFLLHCLPLFPKVEFNLFCITFNARDKRRSTFFVDKIFY